MGNEPSGLGAAAAAAAAASGRLFHVRRPIRVSLADRKEWRTKTTGLGPEWRSNTWEDGETRPPFYQPLVT